LNYVKALESGLCEVRGCGPASITDKVIKDLHRHLMNNTECRGEIGEYRESQNWIGGATIYQARFVPPPADAVPGCMKELVSFLQEMPHEEDMLEIPVVIRMAIAHAQFEMIHPFIDGNGRVGRLLLPLMLAAEGYPPVYIAGFLKTNQQAYYDGLAGVQLREEWSEWIRFFAVAVEESAKDSIRTATALEALLVEWQERIALLKLRSDSAVKRLPGFLIGTPVVSARHVESALGISFPAANNALSKLQELGLLSNPKEQLRNRLFVAHEVVCILNA
jgi:Fic family protein